jgi:hypothetical protein
VADRSSFGSAGNEKPVNLRTQRCGANPLKNESGSFTVDVSEGGNPTSPESILSLVNSETPVTRFTSQVKRQNC